MTTNNLIQIHESVSLAGHAATLLDDAVLLDDGTVLETIDDLDTFEGWPYSYVAESDETDWPYEVIL